MSPAYDYDMASAFPKVASRLYDTRACDWVESGEYQTKAVYGYCKGVVTIYDWVVVSPIIYIGENGDSISAIGTWETYLTKAEIDFIREWGIGEFKIEKGWWAIPENAKRKLPQPFEHIVGRLLEWKKRGGLEGELAKRMSVGLYGKMGEEHETEFGKHFSPAWFAEISTQTRLAEAGWLYRHGVGPDDNDGYSHLLCISVDGSLHDRKIANADGNWKLSYVGKAMVVSSGLVYLGDRKPKGLLLGDILEMIREHPKQAYYQQLIKRRVTLGQALEFGFDKLGKEVEMHTSVDLNMTHDRDFRELPRTGGQLITKRFSSKPLKVKEA